MPQHEADADLEIAGRIRPVCVAEGFVEVDFQTAYGLHRMRFQMGVIVDARVTGLAAVGTGEILGVNILSLRDGSSRKSKKLGTDRKSGNNAHDISPGVTPHDNGANCAESGTRETGWLGREGSNLRMPESKSGQSPAFPRFFAFDVASTLLTRANGLRFVPLLPGKYVLVIDGPGFVAADINRDGVPDSAVRPGNQGNQQGTVTFTVIFTDPPAGTDVHQGTLMFSSETPYCRDVAGQGMRFGIEIPAGGGATMTLTTRKSGHDHQEE